ncbi:MAG: SUMF1/EgtB/PvdO family nonheme iron enzyme [Opitutales bacterium]|nr:SUMF1/EgtB/PvdO family nonheme iron enzyme [Opitutales bacterium]
MLAVAVLAVAAPTATGAGPEPPLPEGFEMKLPAFPGAWGGGMFAKGGRGGRTIAVTNLDDSGPGSFRAALEAEGPRMVVFKVAGVIWLETAVEIEHPYITVAGQTAPGDGVCIAGHSVDINTRDVIIRYLRFRRGNIENRDGCIQGNPEGNVIIDHCSVSWGMDENLSLYRHVYELAGRQRVVESARNITVQWVVNAEALDINAHAYGSTWGGDDSTFHHNLFASHTARVPSIGRSGDFDFRNNVIFNWGHRSMDGGDEMSRVNVINNYYKPGPATREGPLQYRVARAQKRNLHSPGEPPRTGKWFVEGNYVEGHPEVSRDNWNGGVQVDNYEEGDLERARVNEPFPGWPIEQRTAREAYEIILERGGASLPRRDAMDERVIEMVRSGETTFGNGIIDTPDDVGGWPEYRSGPVPLDTTGDGIPDWWAIKHGFDPTDPTLAVRDSNGSGYTNLEEFLNGTDPTVYVDYTDPSNNVNTLTAEVLLPPPPPPADEFPPLPEAETVTFMLPGDVPLEMVRIPSGTFTMGSPHGSRGSDAYRGSQGAMSEEPQREVTLAQPFLMGRYPVTQQQWLAVMGDWNDSVHGHYAATPRNPAATPEFGLGDDYPIYFASWHDANDFAEALNQHLKETGQDTAVFRLPSEAEWEYAARAGTSSRFFFGDSLTAGDGREDGPTGSDEFPGMRSDYMWFGYNAGDPEGETYGTQPVGQKRPNAWGLHDMHGNVWEWCADHRQRSYRGAPTDGSAWVEPRSSRRALRGGGWRNTAVYCRAAARDYNSPALRRADYGFRIVGEPVVEE